VEVPREHGSFDTRWPCVRRDSSEAVPTVSARAEGAWPAGLSLVPTEPVPAAVELESEESGARRLLAAVDAQRAQSSLPADQM
jgi:hypothetical protein